MQVIQKHYGNEYLLARSSSMDQKNWENKARTLITNFYDRAGNGRGDLDRLINFENELPNIVGFALNCFRKTDQLPDPKDWNDDELSTAENGNKEFVFDDNGDVIKAMKESCNDDDFNYVNVLPIVYYTESNLFFTPLFRLRRYYDGKPHFVDAKGKVYNDFEDWEENNDLPAPCSFIFPTDGILDGSNVKKLVKEGKRVEFAKEIAKFGGSLKSLKEPEVEVAQTIEEFHDRIDYNESLIDKENDTLWINRSSEKLTGPLAKLKQFFNLNELKTSKKGTKVEKVSKDSVTNLQSILSSDTKTKDSESVVTEANILLDNQMTIKELMKTQKLYLKTSIGCLKLSILLGFYMNTKFFYYNKKKLELIKRLYDFALQFDKARSFRITNFKEIVVGPLVIEISLLDKFSCEEIVALAEGAGSNHISSNVITDFAKFFQNFSDFLSSMIIEQRDSERSKKIGEIREEADEDVQLIKIHITNDLKCMMTYQNHDYDLLKCNRIIKVIEKRLGVFAKIIHAIRRIEFNFDTSGTIFHISKCSDKFKLVKRSNQTKILHQLVVVYQILRKNHIPFTVKKSPWGRPLFHIGYGCKINLDQLFMILDSDPGSIGVLHGICQLNRKETRKFDFIKWNLNNDRALFKWLRCSFKTCTDGLKQIINLSSDVFSNQFKGIVEVFIADNERETNGLLMIRTGVYKFLITIHVLQQLTKTERMSMMKGLGNLLDHDDLLVNAFEREIFIEKFTGTQV